MNYCVGFLFSVDRTKVVLIEKNRPEWQKGFLNGIGGKIEPNENLLKCMIREFEEETGLQILSWYLFSKLEVGDDIVYFFRAFNSNINNVKTIESEIVGIYEVSKINELKIIDNLSWLIPMALDKCIKYSEVSTTMNYYK